MNRIAAQRLSSTERCSEPPPRWAVGWFRSFWQRWSNKPAAPNAGIAPRFHSRHHWRGVGEPERCPKIEMSASKGWYRHGSDMGDGDCERDPLSESLQS